MSLFIVPVSFIVPVFVTVPVSSVLLFVYAYPSLIAILFSSNSVLEKSCVFVTNEFQSFDNTHVAELVVELAIVFVIVFAVDSDIDSVLESDSSTDIPDVVFPKSFIVYNGTLIIFPISNTNKY